jgi:predicted alpha/beta hydrolase family esterase
MDNLTMKSLGCRTLAELIAQNTKQLNGIFAIKN